MTVYKAESISEACMVRLSFGSFVKIAAIIGFCAGVIAMCVVGTMALFVETKNVSHPFGIFFLLLVPASASLKVLVSAVVGYPIYLWMCKDQGHFFKGKFVTMKESFHNSPPSVRDVF